MRTTIFIISVMMLIGTGISRGILFSQEMELETEGDYIEPIGDEAFMNWTTKVLRVKGTGFGPEKVRHLGRKKILAKRAAKVDAYRNLVEAIKGVRVTSETHVEDLMLESDVIRTQTNGMLKGMQVKEVNYTDEGGCEITVEVNINQNGQFLISALNSGEIKVIDNYPKFDWDAALRDLDKKEKELARLKSNYASLSSDLKKKQEELLAANRELERLNLQLQDADLDKTQLKAQLQSAEKEVMKTKDIVGDLTNKLINQEIKLNVNDKELEITKNFLSDKKRELDELSKEISLYKTDVMLPRLDRERMLGYIGLIKEIQLEAGKIFGASEETQTDGRDRIASTNETAQSDMKTPMLRHYGRLNTGYTGLLVDARGLHLNPALHPCILNEEEQKMYGKGAVSSGPNSSTPYTVGNVEIAKKKCREKIGDNPLVVKCLKPVGKEKSDIMISNEDAHKVVLIRDLLERERVAILR